MAKKATYGNESIKSLRGADRVRKRPAVIFGSDGLEGCEHSIFEIMSNSIDEAREGRGNRIVVTRYLDGSYEVQDFGSGIPVDYNKNEQRENWELLFCEMYAGSKYDTPAAQAVMSSLWASTAWGFAPPSMRRNIWTRKFTGTATATPSILKRARISAACTRNRTKSAIPAPAFAGSRIFRCLRILTFLGIGLYLHEAPGHR